MKKLLILFLFLLSFFLIHGKVLASDLDVTCEATYCILSAKDPVFSPEVKWAPGKTESREILIKNTDTNSKEIYIKARDHETSAKELDSYMNITLSDNGSMIWQGTLADFIEADEIEVVNLGAGKEFILQIEAEMAETIPNDMMGKSSVFNFGFGFEGQSSDFQDENAEEETDSDNSGDSGSSGTSSSDGIGSEDLDNTDTQNQNLITNAFNRLFGVFAGVDEGARAATVAGDQNTTGNERDTLGAGANECRENYLWVLFLITQVIFALTLLLKRFKERLKLLIAGHSFLFIVTVIAIYFISCFLWPILISIIIFQAPLIWLLYKNSK